MEPLREVAQGRWGVHGTELILPEALALDRGCPVVLARATVAPLLRPAGRRSRPRRMALLATRRPGSLALAPCLVLAVSHAWPSSPGCSRDHALCGFVVFYVKRTLWIFCKYK